MTCALLALGAVVGAGAVGTNSVTSPDTTGDVGRFTSLTLDGAGFPVVSYAFLNGFDFDLRVLHCNDANCAGGGESITSPDIGGNVGLQTSLALDAAGNPVVSYLYLSAYDLRVLHCNDPNCAGGGESITSPDTAVDVGYYTSLALDDAGNPVVGYFDFSYFDLKVLHCNDANCQPGGDSVTWPDTVDDVGRYLSLALDAAGNPVVSYVDLTNFGLKVLHCNDANCADGGESITAPVMGTGIADTSLALDASGNPVVSYSQGGNLKLLHCNDANCAGVESITSPDTGGSVGFDTSLALDGSGNPVVSYSDFNNQDLKVLHCNDANCADGGESIMSPDTGGDVGYSTSLALDASGNPVVSYYDNTNGDLKVLHCGDADCSGAKPAPTPPQAATPTPGPVGGITELPGLTAGGGGSAWGIAPAAVAVAVAAGLIGAAWVARRRSP